MADEGDDSVPNPDPDICSIDELVSYQCVEHRLLQLCIGSHGFDPLSRGTMQRKQCGY